MSARESRASRRLWREEPQSRVDKTQLGRCRPVAAGRRAVAAVARPTKGRYERAARVVDDVLRKLNPVMVPCRVASVLTPSAARLDIPNSLTRPRRIAQIAHANSSLCTDQFGNQLREPFRIAPMPLRARVAATGSW